MAGSHRVADEIALRQHDALLLARGARGEDHGAHGVGIRLLEAVVQRVLAVVEDQRNVLHADDAFRRAGGVQRLRHVVIHPRADERLRAAACEQTAQLLRPLVLVERDDDVSAEYDRAPGEDPLIAVLPEQGDAGVPQAVRPEESAECLRLLPELAAADRYVPLAAAVFKNDAVRIRLGAQLEDAPQRGQIVAII